MRARSLVAFAALALAPLASAQVFTNSTPITLPLLGQASTYPSVIHVSGMGDVSSVGIVLNGLSHTYAADLDILLVGPNGFGVYILSDAGGASDFQAANVGFAIGGAPLVASNGVIPSGIYEPTYTAGDETFPGAVYTPGNSLSAFTGWDANGDWKLYIIDDTTGDAGSISGGWSLVFNSPAPGSVTNTFTYQGRLEGITGPVDLQFTQYSTQWFPSSLGVADWPFGISNVQVDDDGLFTVQVPYTRALMDGKSRFLELAVSPAGENNYTVLSPRQPITVAPMAEWANKSGSVPWSGVTGVPAGLSDGIDDAGPWSVVSGNVLYNGAGRVGVGAVSDSYLLNVSAPTNLAMRVHSNSTLGTIMTIANGGDDNRLAMISMESPTDVLTPSCVVIRNWHLVNGGTAGIVLDPDGHVGIATNAPFYTLTVNGTAGKPGGGSWSVYSDARLKHDITPLSGTLDKLLNVHGVSYVYNEPEKIGELPGRQTGVVAQEVETIFPEWVDQGANGYKSVTFRGFEALTIEALRDLRTEKDAQIKALRDENAQLKARLDRLEKAIDAK